MDKEKNNTYLPLPSSLTIKESELHGLGLFAKEDIIKETCLGISHMIVKNRNFENDLFRSPIGGYYNHSDNPNCYTITEDDLVYLYTLKDIKKGEEILVKYSMVPLY